MSSAVESLLQVSTFYNDATERLRLRVRYGCTLMVL